MTKKFIRFIFAAFFAVSIVCSSVSVSAATAVYDEESLQTLTTEKQLAELNKYTNLSEESRAIAEGKLRFMMMSEAERTAATQATMTARGLVAVKICNVPHFRQERSDYCGPATTKQTIHYLTDGAISPTQTQLAGYIHWSDQNGTSSTEMKNWLAKQGYVYYNVPTGTMTIRDIVNYVATGIDAYDYPCFGGIKVTQSQKNSGIWPYKTTDGHILNISGIYQHEPDYEYSVLEFTDPYITWADPNNTSGKHAVEISKYNAVKTSFWW